MSLTLSVCFLSHLWRSWSPIVSLVLNTLLCSPAYLVSSECNFSTKSTVTSSLTDHQLGIPPCSLPLTHTLSCTFLHIVLWSHPSAHSLLILYLSPFFSIYRSQTFTSIQCLFPTTISILHLHFPYSLPVGSLVTHSPPFSHLTLPVIPLPTKTLKYTPWNERNSGWLYFRNVLILTWGSHKVNLSTA